MPSKIIFISHSKKDKQIADKLVDLIETGIGISSDEMFCSSLEGMGIPNGKNFIDFIKIQITDPKIVILLLSQAYYKSVFCLCELGASWAMSLNIIPIIVPPLKYENVKDVLTGIQVVKIDDKAKLNEMQSDIVSRLKITGKSFARWEVKRDEFLHNINEIISNTPSEKIITQENYLFIEKNYKDAVNEIKNMEEEIKILKQTIEDLKKAKDTSEVKSILNSKMTSIEIFEKIKDECKNCFREIPSIVEKALFKKYNNELLQWGKFGYEDLNDSIKEAIDNDFLVDTGDGIDINTDDPKIKRTIEKLDSLERFVGEMKTDEDFLNYYEENYDHMLKFSSKRFWEANL